LQDTDSTHDCRATWHLYLSSMSTSLKKRRIFMQQVYPGKIDSKQTIKFLQFANYFPPFP
jgi:hypothetical protein